VSIHAQHRNPPVPRIHGPHGSDMGLWTIGLECHGPSDGFVQPFNTQIHVIGPCDISSMQGGTRFAAAFAATVGPSILELLCVAAQYC
jgi:hypothetical protein